MLKTYNDRTSIKKQFDKTQKELEDFIQDLVSFYLSNPEHKCVQSIKNHFDPTIIEKFEELITTTKTIAAIQTYTIIDLSKILNRKDGKDLFSRPRLCGFQRAF